MSNDIIRKESIDFLRMYEEKQFHCVFPIKNKKNSLLALIFKQITPNLGESICTPWNIFPPNLRLIDVIVFELEG